MAEKDGVGVDLKFSEAGRYRVELWLDVAGEQQIWILTNPFYVTEERK